MSQPKVSDKTRSRGKANQGTGGSSPGRGKQQVHTPTTPEREPRMTETEEGTLHQRFDILDAELLDVRTFNEQHQADMKVMITLMEKHKAESEQNRRELNIANHKLLIAKESNRRLENQLNGMANQLKECNIRIDGVVEEEGLNLLHLVMELAEAMGIENMVESDIVSTYRVGKMYQAQHGRRQMDRPRTIMVVFRNVQVRNRLFFARATLKNLDKFRGIFVNDDVTPLTRKMRDDYRSVAALARATGAEVRVHSDGIVIDGQKYLLTEPQTLPEQYSLPNSKIIEVNGEIYFQSEHAYLSNFALTPIVEGNMVYLSAEHMYQAQKCRHMKDEGRLKQVVEAVTPLEAKRIADALTETQDWKDIRDTIMERVVSAKFDQNKHLADLLVKTGSVPLNEATRNSHFGIGVNLHAKEIKDKGYHGENKLGRVLMAKRNNIREMREEVDKT